MREQCQATYKLPEGRIGAYGCHTFNCMLDEGHEGPHEDYSGYWPETEKEQP